MAQETDPHTGENHYAVVRWVAGDVTSLRPDWSKQDAENWLSANGKYIEEATIKRGWEAIEDLLPPLKEQDDGTS